MPIGIARMKSFHVGATPSVTLSASWPGFGPEHEHGADDHQQHLGEEVHDRERDVQARGLLDARRR